MRNGERNYYQQVYFKLNAHLDALDDLNIQLTSTSKDEDLDYYNQIVDSIHEQHEKLMNLSMMFCMERQEGYGGLSW